MLGILEIMTALSYSMIIILLLGIFPPIMAEKAQRLFCRIYYVAPHLARIIDVLLISSFDDRLYLPYNLFLEPFFETFSSDYSESPWIPPASFQRRSLLASIILS